MAPVPTLESANLERQWIQLLDYIEAGLVIPVVGRELLWIEIGGRPEYVPAYLARNLAARAGLSWSPEPGPDPIGVVVQRYLSGGESRRNWPYTALSLLVKDLENSEPPAPFIKLAQILPFRLFISTTFDTFLVRALNTVRFNGRAETLVPQYGLASTADLPERGLEGRTTLFPLLGLANPLPDYAVTDEDVLEFVYQFQITGMPRRLLDALRQSHLLLIGSGFSDWLVRFLVRLAKPGRLWTSTTNQLTHFVADRVVTEDPGLLAFLQHPLSDTDVFPVSRVDQFVDELHRRWTARSPAAGVRGLERPLPAVGEARHGGVFLSYASEDFELADRIRKTLDGAGVDVWFDKRDLDAGDEFERKILAQIAKSYFFVAVVSQHSLTSQPRFFRLEWREAETRAKFAAFDLPYVLPILLDDTSPQDERLPLFLRRVQWTRAPGGDLPSEFVDTVVQGYRRFQRPSRS